MGGLLLFKLEEIYRISIALVREQHQMMCLLEETKERAGCPPSIHQSPWMSLIIFSSPLNRRSKEGRRSGGLRDGNIK